MKRIVLSWSAILLIACALWVPTSAQKKNTVPVVLLSIDGLKPDYIIEADKHGLKIPNLRRLFADGAHASGVTGVLPTVTYPSHTTMITGVAPAKHGIYYNTTFDPFGKNMDGWYWYAEDIKAPTLWDATAKAGFVTASVDWPANVSANVTYNIAQYWRTSTPDDLKLIRALSTPGLLAEAERAVGPYAEGNDYTVPGDKRRAAFIAYVLETKKPRFITCYFGALDTDEHASGPYSAKAFETLEAIDALVGQVRQAAEKAGGGHAVLCVVSDHGFARTSNVLRLNVALHEAGLIQLDDKRKVKSWQAAAWGGGGTSAVMLQVPHDAATLQKVRDVLQRLAADPANGILRILDNAAARRLGGFPDAAFVVCAKPGYTISGSLDGAITQSIKPGGTHGYLPELTEMDSSFFIAGPGIRAARDLGRIDMRDIAPTLARLLDVKLPTADGRDVLGK